MVINEVIICYDVQTKNSVPKCTLFVFYAYLCSAIGDFMLKI